MTLDTQHITGLDDLNAKLGLLQVNTQRTVLRSVARKAMKPVLQAARAGIPIGKTDHRTYKGRKVSPGFSSEHLFISTSARDRDKYSATAMVGAGKEAFYAVNFVELGVAKYGIAARPWLRPAFASNHAAMINIVSTQLDKAIEKAVQKQKVTVPADA